MIDLHCHSTASDGSLAPAALMQLAQENQLSAIALTDHDTVDGLPEAAAAAARAGIRFINGIELEMAWPEAGVFHLLGLGIDPLAPSMATLLSLIREARAWRNRRIIERMADHGVGASLEAVSVFADGNVITRPHFADYLVSIGHARDRQGAFDKYLTPGKPFFEPYPGLELGMAVEAIHAAGGKASVAHPLSLYVSWTRLGALMAEWRAAGIDAVEAWHPSASWKAAERLRGLAAEAGLKISAGSDFHGQHRPDRMLGRSLEERRKIDESFLSLFDD
jgi:predicted metal-dependent phosphoesterase TrpH